MRPLRGAALLAVGALVLVPGPAGAMSTVAPEDQASFGVPVGSDDEGVGAVLDVKGLVADVEGPVLDIVGRVGSLDGALVDEGEGAKFTLAADVYFAFDSAQLQPRAAGDLAAVAEQVRASGVTTLVVTGHTDSVGTPEYNLTLSQQRADAVRTALEPMLAGVTVTAQGLGETVPAASEQGEDVEVSKAQAANRRVEIVPGG